MTTTQGESAELWMPVTKAGQVSVGDKLRFTIGDKAYSERAKLILRAGTDKEEVIYDKGRNYYFITAMVLSGFSNHKNVEVLPRKLAASPQVEVAPQAEQVANYKPGRWFDARTLDEMQAFYLSRLPAIREAAKEHGYAIGLHGSERRDFDLMAMQWREGASDKDTLARAIADAACGIRREGAYDWERKPLGRVATSIPVCWTAHDNPDFDKPSVGHIDLSIIERGATQPSTATPERAAAPADLSTLERFNATHRGFEVHPQGELVYFDAVQELLATRTAEGADKRDAEGGAA